MTVPTRRLRMPVSTTLIGDDHGRAIVLRDDPDEDALELLADPLAATPRSVLRWDEDGALHLSPGHTINVKNFRATGDGVTDDTAAIQAAAAALVSGGELYFPQGTYLVSDDILIRVSNVRVRGDGPRASVLKIGTIWTTAPTSSTTVPAVLNLIASGNALGNEGVQIADLEIAGLGFEGTRAAGTANEPKAISGVYADRVWIHGCAFKNFGHEVIWPAGGGVRESTFWAICGNYITQTGYSGTTVGAPSAISMNVNHSTCIGNLLEDNYAGIGVAGNQNAVLGNVVKTVHLHGIGVGGDSNQTDVTIAGNVVNTNASTFVSNTTGIAVTGAAGASSIVISGNAVRVTLVASTSGSPRGIHVYGAATDVLVTGNGVVMDQASLAIGYIGISVDDAGTQAQIVGNAVKAANESSTAHYAYAAPSAGSGTVKAIVLGNRALSFTTGNNGYAYDFNTNAGGTMTLVATDNTSDGGYHRYPDNTLLSSGVTDVPVSYTTGTGIAFGARQYTHQVIATASLPAADSAHNGRIVIEDAGAGDRNLIVYAGGERFRIDGGAAF